MSKQRAARIDKLCLTHDTFFDETFGIPSLGMAFLRAKLPRKIQKQLDIDKLTVVKKKFRDKLFRETRPDIVYHVPIRGTDEHVSIHVIVEHKSFDDHSTIFQLWGYVHQLCVQDVNEHLTDPETKQRKTWPKNFHLSPIIPIIIHHGNTQFSGKIQLAELFYPIPGVKEYQPYLKAILVDLSVIDEGDLPRDPDAPELFVVLLIMKAIFSKSRTALINSFSVILEELQPYSHNPRYRELIRMLLHYVVHNTEKLTETDYEELESEIQETIGDDNMPTLVQKWLAEGMEKGMEKGAIEREAKAILRTLTKRFQSVPESLEEQVRTITDLERLEQLADFAFDCKALDDFAKALK